jgi:predicted  nucleic acid-binding Zn-ribbon protein
MSRSGNLLDLQSFDTALDLYNRRLNEISDILSDSSEINQAEKIFQEAKEAFIEAQKKLKTAEENVKSQRLKIKSTDAKLYGGRITNPKELEDLQGESEALKRYLSVLEDRQLESMLELDDHKESYVNAKNNLEAVEGKIRSRHDDLIHERMIIQDDMKNFESKKVSIVALIDTEDLSLYEKIRTKSHGMAVAEVLNQSCTACGATLTAALNQAARSRNQITLCETCGRILIG